MKTLLLFLLISGVAHSQDNSFLTLKPGRIDTASLWTFGVKTFPNGVHPANDTVSAIFLVSDLSSGDTAQLIVITGFNLIAYSSGQRGDVFSFSWADITPLGKDKKPLPATTFVWMSHETGQRKHSRMIAL